MERLAAALFFIFSFFTIQPLCPADWLNNGYYTVFIILNRINIYDIMYLPICTCIYQSISRLENEMDSRRYG